MGQAKVRQINEGKVVKFDFDGPDIAGVSDGTKRALVVHIIVSIVRAAYPQGQDRRDGRIWSAWQEDLLDSEAMKVDVTMGQIDWLAKHVESETLKLDPGLAQAREALAEYLTQLKMAAKNDPA